MTLRTKILKHNRSGLMLLALIPIFFACDDPNTLGIELEDVNAKTTTELAEFILPAQTIYIDSLLSQELPGFESLKYLTFGSISNENVYGNLKAISYTEYTSGSGVIPFDSLEFEEAFVILKSSGFPVITNDNPQQIVSVFESTDTLFSSVLYPSNYHLEYDDSNPIGALSETITNQDSLFKISLNESFGKALYRRLDLANNLPLDDTNRTIYLDSITSGNKPALVFQPSDNNQSLFTFDMLSDTVGIYLQMRGVVRGERHYYKFNFSNDQYSEIIRDRSGSQYASLVNDYDSVSNQDFVHLNMIAGLHPRLDLSPLINFLKENENIIINRAEFSIGNNNQQNQLSPAINSFRFLYPNTAEKRINGASIYQNFNVISYSILGNSDYFNAPSGINSVLTNSLNEDKTQYNTGIVTNFCQWLLDNYIDNDQFVTTQVLLYGTNRLQVGQSEIPSSDIRLKVYFTRLN